MVLLVLVAIVVAIIVIVAVAIVVIAVVAVAVVVHTAIVVINDSVVVILEGEIPQGGGGACRSRRRCSLRAQALAKKDAEVRKVAVTAEELRMRCIKAPSGARLGARQVRKVAIGACHRVPLSLSLRLPSSSPFFILGHLCFNQAQASCSAVLRTSLVLDFLARAPRSFFG